VKERAREGRVSSPIGESESGTGGGEGRGGRRARRGAFWVVVSRHFFFPI